jgi:hypothetical protein
MKKIRFRSSTLPVAFFVACLISYGLLIPWLGFYWDDWPYSWFAHILGSAGFVKAFANDRPFLSLVYMITTPLFGSSPLAWQLFALVTRYATVLSLWWVFGKVWPYHKRQVAWVCFLFAVFPGFGQQWISVIYSQVFIILTAFFGSIGLNFLAYQKPRWFWPLTLMGIFLSAFSLFSTEYFFGLELLRPVFLWIFIGNAALGLRDHIKRTALHWSPYLVTWLGYSVYRLILFQSPTYKGYNLQVFDSGSPGMNTSIIQSIRAMTDTFGKGAITAWTQTFQIFSSPVEASSTFLYFAVAILSFILILVYLSRLEFSAEGLATEKNKTEDQWAIQAMLIGLVGIFLGRLPSWAAGLPLDMTFPWDRFMVSIMLGSSLLTVGLIEFFIKTSNRKILLVALLVGISASKQFQNANSFRRALDTERNFFWQLSWRIPGLKPGTMLLTHELNLQYYSDYSLSAPLNLIYAPNLTAGQPMPYLLLFTKARYLKSLPSLAPNTPVNFDYRAMTFTGNTSQSVTIYMPNPGCLRILDSKTINQNTIPRLPSELVITIPNSNVENILPDVIPPAVPQKAWFGSDPAHTWCYYFAKSELAFQQNKWQEIIDLWNSAQSKGYNPEEPSEKLVFIHAFAHEIGRAHV